MERAWIDLDPADIRQMLISLIGFRFGDAPEQRLADIRAERQAYAGAFVDLAGIGPDDTVLDLGSGCGFGTAALARRARSVVACDISPAFLAFAQRECAGLDNVRFQRIEPRDLAPLEAAGFDTVVAMSLFIHFNLYDIACHFAEFGRVLKPRGRVVFDFADGDRLFARWRNHGNDALFREHTAYYLADPSALPGLLQWNSARAITQVAKDAGFRRLRRRGHKLLFARR
jgi:SAM-dependent methyltransferase